MNVSYRGQDSKTKRQTQNGKTALSFREWHVSIIINHAINETFHFMYVWTSLRFYKFLFTDDFYSVLYFLELREKFFKT